MLNHNIITKGKVGFLQYVQCVINVIEVGLGDESMLRMEFDSSGACTEGELCIVEMRY